MREGFFGLNVALRGLYSAQRGLDVVNHNINNITTPGYSRQVAVQQASRPMPLFDGTGMLGTGSDITTINRVRDEYLDFKYWSENTTYGEWSSKEALLSDVEATFNEPSENGFTEVMDEFYNSLHTLAKDSGSLANRAIAREKGVTLCKYFNSVYSHFEKMQGDLNYQIKTRVEEINSYGTQIQQLNRQIYTSELDGNTANDLRDQRTQLVDKLSKLINIDASEVASGQTNTGKPDMHFVITISGKAFVDHFNLSELSIPQRTVKQNDVDIDSLYNVEWADGNKLDIRGGILKGIMDVRDGNVGQNASPLYKGIPYYMKKMNEFVQTFAMSFNEGFTNIKRDLAGNVNNSVLIDGTGHADGYKLDSLPTDPISAVRFFTIKSYNGTSIDTASFLSTAASTSEIADRYKTLTAKNIAVSLDVMNDTKAISIAGQPAQDSNIDVVNKLLAARHNKGMFAEGSPEDYMKSLVTTLGIDTQQAKNLAENQLVIVKQIDNRKLSDSGVSIDEEMTNLVKFQQAYSASAKMISTMAEVYDILINRLGV
jgi:flagellar hook-associated protein 1 FlgK